jgi:hypothetical protein
MIRTNIMNLLEIGVLGKITHTVVDDMYMTTWTGEPTMGLGRGGIIYNVRPGDPCFGWSWGEKVEPGVSVDGVGNDGAKGSFRNYTCIGNRATVVDGEAKGDKGVVVGKVGYLPKRAHHVIVHFTDNTKEKLSIDDKIQVRSVGVGLKFLDYPEVRAVGISPQLLETMGLEERNEKLIIPVTKIIPPEYVGQGSGGAPAEASNWDVMTQSPDAVDMLNDLRLGDIVCLKDILSAWGRGYFEGAYTIGVVSCGSSQRMGQGIGITVLLTCREEKIELKQDKNANLTKYLNLGGE